MRRFPKLPADDQAEWSDLGKDWLGWSEAPPLTQRGVLSGRHGQFTMVAQPSTMLSVASLYDVTLVQLAGQSRIFVGVAGLS